MDFWFPAHEDTDFNPLWCPVLIVHVAISFCAQPLHRKWTESDRYGRRQSLVVRLPTRSRANNQLQKPSLVWDDYVGSESLAGWFAQLQIRDMGQQVNRIVHLMSASSMHDFGGGGALARRVTACICPHPTYVTSPPVPSFAPTTCHGPCQKVGGTDTCKGLKRKSQKHTEERLRWIRPSWQCFQTVLLNLSQRLIPFHSYRCTWTLFLTYPSNIQMKKVTFNSSSETARSLSPCHCHAATPVHPVSPVARALPDPVSQAWALQHAWPAPPPEVMFLKRT